MSPSVPRRALAAALVVVALAASGCGTSTKSTNPADAGGALTQGDANDVALQTLFALDQVGTDVNGGASMIVGPTLAQRAAHPFHVAWDTSLTIGTLNATVTRNFYDDAGNVLDVFGPTAVRMTWQSHIWGDVQTWRDTATVQHHSSLTFTGLQPADPAITLSGVCTDTLLNRFHPIDSLVTHFGYWRSTLTATGIVFPRTSSWPSSGTLTYVVKVDKLRSGQVVDVEKHLSVVVVITFNGTSQPDLVVGGTYHYHWDMTDGGLNPA
jgi:hypothetical protein